MVNDKILKSKTLLSEFISQKVRNYVEPRRKGTPRGRQIGFSLTKYKASLLFITGLTLREIAFELGCSYVVLRRWNTESEFKKHIEKHREEFWDFVIKFVRNQISKSVKEKSLSYEDSLKALMSRLNKKMGDFYLYNEILKTRFKYEVLKEIEVCLVELKQGKLSEEIFLGRILFINLALNLLRIENKRWEIILNNILKILSRLPLKQERKILIEFLNLLLNILRISF